MATPVDQMHAPKGMLEMLPLVLIWTLFLLCRAIQAGEIVVWDVQPDGAALQLQLDSPSFICANEDSSQSPLGVVYVLAHHHRGLCIATPVYK